jgi:hypothetical protein
MIPHCFRRPPAHRFFLNGGTMYINPDQRAIVLRRGVIRKVVKEANAARLPGLVIEVFDIYHKFEPKGIALEQAAERGAQKGNRPF